MIRNNNRNSRDDKSKSGKSSTGRRTTGTDKPQSRFNDKEGRDDSRKSGFEPKEKRTYKPRTESGFKSREGGDDRRKSSFDPKEKRAYKPRTEGGFKSKEGFNKPWDKKEGPRPFKAASSKDGITESKRGYAKRDDQSGEDFKSGDRRSTAPKSFDSRPFRKREEGSFKPRKEDKGERVAPATRSRKPATSKDDDLIRLNRYIANSGICSRRKADELIEAGVISVNGVPVTELGHKVDPYKDEVRYNGEVLKREKKVYVLLNKPKDYITTTDDPQERRTVMQLVEKASRERIYPVGRLDRNTTGLLLMTNDGELADKLSHPKNGITKIYHVELNKNLSQGDFNKIEFGLELEDGLIKPDNISYVAGASKKEIGIQIHSGKNRIVRRIFEHLGYEVVKLDRVVYGSLTKKDLPRGRWRFLEEHELIQIKHLIK
ncbi:pseudouridine synthase [Pedobacter sp. KR3-3]|uniref:Pseudouridine synthase n=1 Tax=Pedobacter albus TaxID=3113905 RepID=A0ABU7ICJ7_9SPHI|nr:pseudouridine synthase [Pedobacter sp. KR3-3]MEE1947092.1 pseudouridine synthase [Pedobacter sp. KR3-3]